MKSTIIAMKSMLTMRSNTKQVLEDKFLLILVMIFGIVPAACSQVPIEGEIMDNVEEIASENYSNYPDEGEITKTFTTKEVFKSEWDMVHSGMDSIPELPSINFDQRNVILIMLEPKPSGGFGIAEVTVRMKADQLTIQYAEIQPGAQCFTTQAFTRPYTFISIPKSDKEIKFFKGEPVINDCN